jgi:hypothetical protein
LHLCLCPSRRRQLSDPRSLQICKPLRVHLLNAQTRAYIANAYHERISHGHLCAALSFRCSRGRAADDFDQSHRQRTEQADGRLARLACTRDELRDGRAFAHATSEVFRGRYRVNEPPQTVKRVHGKQKKKKKWTLFDSIWAPRVATSDARDFWDTMKVKRSAFDQDWAIALRVRLISPQ